jgi:hypothetical protein
MTNTEIEGEIIREETRHLPAVRAHEAMVTRAEVSVEDVIAQRDKIKAVMAQVMADGVHYGRIPGVSKPTLFKSGAEVLNTTFRLAPSYVSERIFHDDGHLTVIAKCVLTHAPSGMVLAEGEGMCSSREMKYAWRAAARSCPVCGAEAIIKGKQEYGGGWLCWKNHKTNPGCGTKFQDGDTEIEGQATGKITNPDLADTWNTVLKMADKRALVAAVLNGTAASDIFTQDVEDSHVAADAEREAAAPPTPVPPVEKEGPPAPSLTSAQAKKLDVLVGQLRDGGHLTTKQLWDSLGRAHVFGSDGELHWSELRESLTKDEASALIERLQKFQDSLVAA